MEPVSLGIGVVGLAALFNTLLDTCKNIHTYRKFGVDYRYVGVHLDNLTSQLHKWGERVGFGDDSVQDQHHPSLDDQSTLRLAWRNLQLIHELIERICGSVAEKSKALLTNDGSSRLSSVTPAALMRSRSRLGKAKWALLEKEHVMQDLNQLDTLVNALDRLIPADHFLSDLEDESNQPADTSLALTDIALTLDLIKNSMNSPHISSGKQRQKVKAWLDACSTATTQDRLRSYRTQNTCAWILNNTTYIKWLEGSSDRTQPRTLWINAPAGCGKSFLSAFLIDQHIDDDLTLYFFCSGSTERTRVPTSILRSCIVQATNNQEILSKAYTHSQSSDTLSASEVDLWQLHDEIIALDIRVTIIVDGFDECSDFEHSVDQRAQRGRSSFLKRFHQSLQGTLSRLIVISRYCSDIASALGCDTKLVFDSGDALEYQIRGGDLSDDVRSYAAELVLERLPGMSVEDQDEITSLLAQKSEGSFLWVSLQKPLLTPVNSTQRIKEEINGAPAEVPDLYDNDWQRIQGLPDSERNRSLLLLRWVTFATGPLTIAELYEAVKIQDASVEEDITMPVILSSSESGQEEASASKARHDTIINELMRLAGSFAHIQISEEEPDSFHNTMEIVHITAKWFLIRMFKGDLHPRLSLTKDNVLASLCIKYLERSQSWRGLDDTVETNPSCPFRTYAIFWPNHADVFGAGGQELETSVENFFLSNQNSLKWKRIYETELWSTVVPGLRKNLVGDEVGASYHTGRLSHFAAYFGFNRILRNLDAKGILDVNEEGSMYGTPLQAACARNHLPTVLFLLQRGADANHRGGIHTTALHAAAWGGDLLIARALLKKGAKVDAVDSSGFTALHDAVGQANVEVLTVLISVEAPIDNHSPRCRTTPLLHACYYGYGGIIKQLLDAGASFALCDDQGWDAVMIAAMCGHTEVVNQLIDAGARTDTIDNCGESALHVAARNGHAETMKLLVSHLSGGRHLISSMSKAIGIAASAGHLSIVESLLEGPYSLSLYITEGRLPIHLAAENGHPDIVKLLHSKGADVNALTYNASTALILTCDAGEEDTARVLLDLDAKQTPCGNGRTPIFAACKKGLPRLVELLLEHGANVHASNQHGETPIIIASSRGYNDIVNVLIAHGANVNDRSLDGNPALVEAVLSGNHETVLTLLIHGANLELRGISEATALFAAVNDNNIPMAKLLIDSGANVDVEVARGWTPFLAACEQGYDAAVSLLLQHRVSLDKRASNRTALHWAAARGNDEVIAILIRQGFDIHAVDDFGSSALHLAAEAGKVEAIETLITCGIPVNSVNNNGQTALMFAAVEGHEHAVEWLLGSGADMNIYGPAKATALVLGARNGHLQVVKKLVKRMDASNVDFRGGFLLRHALHSEETEVVPYLWGICTEHHLVDHLGRSALHGFMNRVHIPSLVVIPDLDVIARRPDKLGCSALHHIVRESDCEVIRWVIDSLGLDINEADNHGWTPLHWAARFGNSSAVRLLLERGADLSLKDWRGWRAGQLALYSNNSDTAEIFREQANGLTISEGYQVKGKTIGGDCDSCDNAVIDTMHHCLTCPINFDLCFRCYQDKDNIHPRDHVFTEDHRYE